MKIIKIKVLTYTNATDVVFLETDLPTPYHPSLSKQNLTPKFDVESGKGLEYVRTHFPGIPVEEIALNIPL